MPPPLVLSDAERRRVLPRPAKNVQRAMEGLEKAAGGRGSLAQLLAEAGIRPEFEHLVGMLMDPANDRKSLATVCLMARVSLQHFLAILRDARGAAAVHKAMEHVQRVLPDVAKDVGERALPRWMACNMCLGKKEIEIEVAQYKPRDKDDKPPTELKKVSCGQCSGTGLLELEPDIRRQEMILQMGGLMKAPGSGDVNVGIGVGLNVGLMTQDSLRDFRTATDRLLYPERREGVEQTPMDIEAEEVKAQGQEQAGQQEVEE